MALSPEFPVPFVLSFGALPPHPHLPSHLHSHLPSLPSSPPSSPSPSHPPLTTTPTDHRPPGISTGVKSYDVSLETQTADVVTEEAVAYETVLEKIKKTGKVVRGGVADGVVMGV